MAACVVPLIAGAQGGPPNQGPAKVVATEVAGKVTAVLFEEGQRVRKGQILV